MVASVSPHENNQVTAPVLEVINDYSNPITVHTETAVTKSVAVQSPNIPAMPTQTPNIHSDEATKDLQSISKLVLMTDEGLAFPLVCEAMGWVHILDRKTITDQISTSWTNLSDPDAFRDSITEILDSTSINVYTTLTRSAKNVCRTHKAKAFLNKIDVNKKRLVFVTPPNISRQLN